MNRVEIIDTNPDNIREFGFCGYKNIKKEGYKRKIDWLKQRFSEGMKFQILHSESDGDVGFIEYIPGEYTWRAIEATGYMAIHCIMIISKKYKEKGYGSLILETCLRDAKKENMHGVAAVTSKGTWMVGKELFLKHGFEVVDEAPPSFELLVRRFTDAPTPEFKGDWGKKLDRYRSGLTIITSDQCPYCAKAVGEISETARKFGLKAKLIELNHCLEAQNSPTAFGIFSIVYEGKLLADHPISNKRFMNIMNKIL